VDRLSLLNAVRLGTLVAQEGQGEVDALDLAECWERSYGNSGHRGAAMTGMPRSTGAMRARR
jgi:hypothetical protein